MRRGSIWVGIAIAVLLAGCQYLEPSPPPPPPRITPLPFPTATALPAVPTPRSTLSRFTRSVTRGTFTKTVVAPGSLASARQMPVFVKLPGVITELQVKVGDQVEAGQVLGRVELPDAELAPVKAESDLAEARSRRADLQFKLSQAKASPPVADDEIEAAQHAVEQARLDLRKAQGRDYEQELQAAERRYRWAKDAAEITAWWYSKVKDLNNQEAWKAGGEAAQASENLYSTQLAYETLKAGKDLWLQELVLKERAVIRAEKHVEDLKRQAVVTQELYGLQVQQFEKEVAEAQVLVERAEKAVQQVSQNGDLVSPLTGIVMAVDVAAGDLVQAYTPLLLVVDTKASRAMVNVAEADIASLTVGQQVQVSVPALEARFPGKITWIAVTPSKDEDPSYQAVISLDELDGRARVGMTAQAEIAAFKKEGILLIPSAAIHTRGDKRFVDVVDGDRLIETEVQVGLRNEVEAEVVAGLEEGQVVSLGTRIGAEATLVPTPAR